MPEIDAKTQLDVLHFVESSRHAVRSLQDSLRAANLISADRPIPVGMGQYVPFAEVLAALEKNLAGLSSVVTSLPLATRSDPIADRFAEPVAVYGGGPVQENDPGRAIAAGRIGEIIARSGFSRMDVMVEVFYEKAMAWSAAHLKLPLEDQLRFLLSDEGLHDDLVRALEDYAPAGEAHDVLLEEVRQRNLEALAARITALDPDVRQRSMSLLIQAGNESRIAAILQAEERDFGIGHLLQSCTPFWDRAVEQVEAAVTRIRVHNAHAEGRVPTAVELGM